MSPIKHVFLDRDGTIIKDEHYLCEPDQVQLLPGAAEALAALSGNGCKLYLVSNQSGIGRGYFDEGACRLCQDRLADTLAEHGVSFVDMAFCPHAPEQGCDCRKPALGMWKQMAALYGMQAGECAMVGDKKEDVAFGRKAGFAASVMVLTGHGQEHAAALELPPLPDKVTVAAQDWQRREDWPHALAMDLSAAVQYLLAL